MTTRNMFQGFTLSVAVLTTFFTISLAVFQHYSLSGKILQKENELSFHKVQSLLFEDTDTANIVVDEDGVIVSWSRGAEVLFGMPKEEIVGQNIGALIPERMQEQHERMFDKHVKSGNTKGKKVVNCTAPLALGTEEEVVINVRSAKDSKGKMFMSGTIDLKRNVDVITEGGKEE